MFFVFFKSFSIFYRGFLFFCFFCFALSLEASDLFQPKNRPYNATHYKIELNLDPRKDANFFSATTTLHLKATEAIHQITVDASGLKVKKVTLDSSSQKLRFLEKTKEKEIEITLPKKIAKGKEIRLQFQYEGKIHSTQEGLFKVTDPDEPSRGILYFTQLEATSARKFFPCNDEPQDKATTEMWIQIPQEFDAISNGKRVSSKIIKKNKENWKKVHWVLEKEHPTYLVSLAVGKFAEKVASSQSTNISVYMPSSKIDKAQFALEVARYGIDFLEKELNIPYPWPQYSIIGVPTFLWGGMENTSATHQNQDRTLLNDPTSSIEKNRIGILTAHELSHQWFGDFATLKWWDDLWLNEAFASFLSTEIMTSFLKTDRFEIEAVLETWDRYFKQENGPRSHALIYGNLTSVDDAFDAVSYTKGESILKMLRFYVGKEVFQKGLHLYLKNYSYRNATYFDFFNAMETAYGRSLKEFRNTWLLQRGYPILSFDGKWEGKTSSYALHLNQQSNHSLDTTRFHFKLPVVFHRRTAPQYEKEEVFLVENTDSVFSVSLPEEPEWITINPKAEVLCQLKPKGKNTDLLILQIQNDPDPISRIWASYELLTPLNEGGELASSVEDALSSVLKEDPSYPVRIALLIGLQKIKNRYLPEKLGDSLYTLAATIHASPTYSTSFEGVLPSSVLKKSEQDFNEWKAQLLGTLAKVKKEEVLPFLATLLAKSSLSLDEVSKASLSVAGQGLPESAKILKQALETHKTRGYAYQFSIQYAFGAYETPAAAKNISELAKSSTADLMGRLSRVIKDNHTLRTSPEWSSFLEQFVLEDTRFFEEVKTRLLETIEDVKTNPVKEMLNKIRSKTASERIRDFSIKILEKNFKT